MKKILYLIPFCLLGCQDVKQEWVKMLSSEGLAIVFAMVCMFVFAPAIGYGIYNICCWMGKRVDGLLDSHKEWMERLVKSNEIAAQSLGPLTKSVEHLVEIEPVWHQNKFAKLQLIHDDLKIASTKVDEIHKIVLIDKIKNGEE